MSDRNLSMASDGGPDDLPRTFRREREAKEREAREREARERDKPFIADPAFDPAADPGLAFRDEPQAAVVTALNVPFFRLMAFFVKAVFAAIPALIILGVLLWGVGQLLTSYFPWLLKMKILITFPN